MLGEILIGGVALFLLASASGGSSRPSGRRYINNIEDLRKKPNPKHMPYYAWIYDTKYFIADAELNGLLYRFHKNGQLTKFNPEIKVETVCSMSIFAEWDMDTIFFAQGGHLYVANERLYRYNKYVPEANYWITISEYDFKMAREKHKNEQRQQEQSV